MKEIANSCLSAVQVEVAVRALVAVPAGHVWLASAVTVVAVTLGQEGVGVEVGADGVTLARLAAGRIARLLQGQSVAEETRLAALAVFACAEEG